MDQNNIEAALAAGVALAETQRVVGRPGAYVVLPEGYKTHSLEYLQHAPDHKRGTVTMFDADSFVRFFNLHKSERSQVYGQLNPPVFVGVLDDHGADGPAWQGHRVKYSCPISDEWQTWTASSKRAMKQEEFAEFIENNLPDIVEPAGADMLEVSRSLQAKKKVSFSSGIRLQNGETQFTYEEDIQGTSARGTLQIPETFVLGIPVLLGGDPYRVEARLRYRITDNKTLLMWFELIRPHKILEDAVNAVWFKIEASIERTIFNGSI